MQNRRRHAIGQTLSEYIKLHLIKYRIFRYFLIGTPLFKKYSKLFILLSLLPIIWIFWKIDYQKLWSLTLSLPPWIFIFLIVSTLLSVVVQVWRVWILTKVYMPDLRFMELLSFHMISAFYTTFLPAASQDVIRSALLSKKGNYSYIWGATLLSRFAGLATLLLFSLNGLLIIDKNALPPYTAQSILIIFLVTVLLTFLSFSKTVTRPLRKTFGRFIPVKVFKIIADIRDGVYAYKKHKMVLVKFFLISIALQLIFVITNTITLYSISNKFFLKESLAFLPMIEIITSAAAFTPQGIGVREILLVFFFKYLQLSGESLGLYILLIYTFSTFSRLLGAIPLYAHFIIKKKQTIPVKNDTSNQT